MEEMFLRSGEFVIPGNLLDTVSDKCDTAAIIPFWYSDCFIRLIMYYCYHVFPEIFIGQIWLFSAPVTCIHYCNVSASDMYLGCGGRVAGPNPRWTSWVVLI